MALGEHLEDQFGGPVGQCEVAQLVENDELGARVAANDAGELAPAFGFLELVGQRGERGEAHPSALLAGADSERGSRGASFPRAAIQEPSASAAIVVCGI